MRRREMVSTAAPECTVCETGKASSAGASECSECPAGLYQDKEGAHECFNCTFGKYSANSGETSCQECSKLGTTVITAATNATAMALTHDYDHG
jgi:hypothetical protein